MEVRALKNLRIKVEINKFYLKKALERVQLILTPFLVCINIVIRTSIIEKRPSNFISFSKALLQKSKLLLLEYHDLHLVRRKPNDEG